MGDAFKCTNCGTVVGTPQRCPSCDGTAMRPVQVPAGSDVVSGNESQETQSAASGEPPDAVTGTADSDSRETTGGASRERSGLLAWLQSLF